MIHFVLYSVLSTVLVLVLYTVRHQLIIHHNDHCKNHIDVVFPYTHTHTVLVHDNQICKLLTRLISAHILRTENYKCPWGPLPGGRLVRGRPSPDFKQKFFNIICTPRFWRLFCSEIFNSIIKILELSE